MQHNYLETLPEAIAEFPNLKSLYVHCNYISDMNEFVKLKRLPLLRTLTVHGNAIDRIDNFRLIVISILPNIKKLDTVVVTYKERDNAEYMYRLRNITSLPKYEGKDCPKVPRLENEKTNNDGYDSKFDY